MLLYYAAYPLRNHEEDFESGVNMKWWFKGVLISIVSIELAAGAYMGFLIYKRGHSQVLGAVSVINKTINRNGASNTNLIYYYEPTAGSREVDLSSWLTQQVVWTYNHDTLNDVQDYSVEKPPDTYRIITLGDSFTFGDHVNTGEAWPTQLENLLNASQPCSKYTRYEVLNLGLRGFDIQDEVERYRLRGQKYRPDLVIWMLIPNDFNEINELLDPLVDQRLVELQKERHIVPLLSNQMLTTDAVRMSLVQQADDDADKLLWKKYSQQALYAMENTYVQNFTGLYGGPLLFATFPFVNDQDKTEIAKWVHARSLMYYMDNLPDIYKDSSLFFSQHGDGHPTPLAHTIIAKDIYDYIKGEHLISCQ